MDSCIRDSADRDQLSRCMAILNELQVEIEYKSNIMNLAGNEVRLKILYLLNMEQSMCPCDLSDVLKMTVPAVSQHLKKLKEANIVISEKMGQTIFYSIDKQEATLLFPILESINSEKV